MFWFKAYYLLLIFCFGTNLSKSLAAISLTDLEIKQICHGLEFKYVAHPSNEKNYVICVPEGGFEKECDANTCFDERDPPCSTTCNSNTNVADQATKDYCNDNNTSPLDRVANGKDCESYYLCMGKDVDPMPLKCPPNQHYSEEHKKCLNYSDANCAATTKWCKKRRDGTRFPHTNCYRYYECQGEKTVIETCSYGEHFDRELNKCASGICQEDTRKPSCKNKNDGSRLVHAKCYKYYVCLNQSLFEAQCASDDYFNDKLGSCVRDVNNNCNDI